jgi:glycosyltransferase involved in cell wall biosynthesis
MKVLIHGHKNSGVSLHRLINPMRYMPDVEIVKTFDDKPDIFFYNRILPEEIRDKIADLKALHGFKTIVDIDDYWELDNFHILYDEYQRDNFAQKQIRHIREADAVLCTHERLAMEIMPYNGNVHVLPNAIPKADQFIVERVPHHLIRLYWQGSPTHRADIGILAHPAHLMSGLSTKIQMVMAGYNEGDAVWHQMVMDYTAGLKHQYKIIPAGPAESYYKSYSEADICLVPLVRSRFNSGKSNLKVLEAANLALPVIASEVHPYLDMPVLYANRASDWVKHIKKLVRSRGARRDAGLELKEFADAYFNFNKINDARRQIFEYVNKTTV